MNGAVGAAFWLAFFAILAGCAWATRRHDRRQELDVYAAMTADERAHDDLNRWA